MSASTRTAALVSSNGFPTIKIDSGMLLVGRSAECDVVVDSKKVSRRHCCLALVREELHVRDLGSTNGCWKTGERHNDFSVEEGQTFSIGDAEYRFQWDQPSDQIVLPSSLEAAQDRSGGPKTMPDSHAANRSPESSDPFLHMAGLA